jgi:hypothetical protein
MRPFPPRGDAFVMPHTERRYVYETKKKKHETIESAKTPFSARSNYLIARRRNPSAP